MVGGGDGVYARWYFTRDDRVVGVKASSDVPDLYGKYSMTLSAEHVRGAGLGLTRPLVSQLAPGALAGYHSATMCSFRPTPRTIADPERAERVATLRDRLLGRQEILVACLHGSFHEGLAFRDVDVAVWVDPASGIEGDWEFATDLAISLSQAVGLAVDVQVLNRAPLAFRYHALRGEPLVARDAAFLADLRAATWDRYFDFQPFALEYWREAMHG